MQNSVSSLFDSSRIRFPQYLLVGVILFALILDGLDTQLLALVTPLILKEWQIGGAAFAPALAAALVGMAAGGSVGGWLGDRLGRRPILIASTIFFGVATAAAGFTEDVTTLTILRLLSGIGFGAASPNGLALATEWLPHRARARAVGVLATAIPLGGMIGAGSLIFLLPELGWRGCFVACGVATIVFGVGMLAWLPESTGYLLQKGRREKAAKELRRIAAIDVPAETLALEAGERVKGRTIFVRELARLNIGTSITFIAIQFMTFAVSSWMPTVLTDAGLSMPQALRGSLYFNSFSITATFILAAVIVRTGSKPLLIGACAAAAVLAVAMAALLVFGGVRESAVMTEALLLVIGLSGAACGVAIATIYAILSFGYPVDRRSTGIGFGMMMGRLGGIASILSSGSLLRMGGGSPLPFFATLLAAMVVATACAFIIDRHIPAAGKGSRQAQADDSV